MSKSYDLSTSTKWANLADGEHIVKLRAKGAGYGTSSFSNSVTVTKGTTGETWLLNSTLTNSAADFTVGFVSNGVSYSRMARDYKSLAGEVQSNDLVYYEEPTPQFVYDNGSWADEAYRTITFAIAPTGDLLTWLQANGTKQVGG